VRRRLLQDTLLGAALMVPWRTETGTLRWFAVSYFSQASRMQAVMDASSQAWLIL
jgi:hypothetical protein